MLSSYKAHGGGGCLSQDSHPTAPNDKAGTYWSMSTNWAGILNMQPRGSADNLETPRSGSKLMGVGAEYSAHMLAAVQEAPCIIRFRHHWVTEHQLICHVCSVPGLGIHMLQCTLVPWTCSTHPCSAVDPVMPPALRPENSAMQTVRGQQSYCVTETLHHMLLGWQHLPAWLSHCLIDQHWVR